MGARAEPGRGRIDDPVTGRFLDPNYSGYLVPTNTGIPSATSIVETAVSRQYARRARIGVLGKFFNDWS
jgi:hypothetical protein